MEKTNKKVIDVDKVKRLFSNNKLEEALLSDIDICDNCIVLKNNNFRLTYTLSSIDAKSSDDIGQLADQVGINNSRMVSNHQIHSNLVRKIDESTRTDIKDADAMTSNIEDTGLIIYTADCVPVVLIDPINKAVAAIHAGWRGTYGSIVEESISMMEKEYKTEPGDLHAYIGPFIGLGNFEVGDDLYYKFEEFMKEKSIPMSDWQTAYDKIGFSYHLDLGRINELLMLALGVKSENINKLNICTVENSDLFYSYRAHNKTDKRIGTIIEIL